MFRFNAKYFAGFILLLLIEICIALYVHDRFIRPYVGDILVVPLLYCFVKSFLSFSPFQATVAVLLFAYFIETVQYFQGVQRLGLTHIPLARIIIGNSFSWLDMLAYTFGAALILLVEWITSKRSIL